MKQRFSELLAVVLILAMVGLLVYMLLPSKTKSPKPSPVTVRSTASVEERQRYAAPKLSYQTPPSSQVLRKSSVAPNAAPQITPHSTTSVASNGNQGNHSGMQNVKLNVQQSINKAANCTSVLKPGSRVGTALLSLPIVSGLVSDLANCSS